MYTHIIRQASRVIKIEQYKREQTDGRREMKMRMENIKNLSILKCSITKQPISQSKNLDSKLTPKKTPHQEKPRRKVIQQSVPKRKWAKLKVIGISSNKKKSFFILSSCISHSLIFLPLFHFFRFEFMMIIKMSFFIALAPRSSQAEKTRVFAKKNKK